MTSMALYTGIDLLIIALPLILSFDRRVGYYRKWPIVLTVSLIVGSVYLSWDVLMTVQRHWGFNERYAGSFRLLGLPLGEILFFFCVPFSCLFIYEVSMAYFREKKVAIPRPTWFVLAALFFAVAVVFQKKSYTFSVMLSVGAFFLLSSLISAELLKSFHFWISILLSYIPFLIVNGILTALPVVVYNQRAIWGLRLSTIPLEDFFYSFSLLGFNFLVYRFFRRLWRRKDD